MAINTLPHSSLTAVDHMLKTAGQCEKKYGFIIIVLGHVNEEQGHLAPITSQLYPTLKKNVRITDIIFRFSEDSWLICIDNCNEQVLKWTQYILQSVLYRRSRQIPNYLEGVLTSMHGFFLPENTADQPTKVFESEAQIAKNSLRHLKSIHSTVLESASPICQNQARLMPSIHQEILDNRLFLAFQPIVHSASRKINYYECLVRILNEEGQIVPAGSFIPQCEKVGIISLIDQKVQQLAIQELMVNRNLKLAINVSAITASDSQWLLALKAQMAARPDLQERLIIELTETSVFQNIDESIQFITQLRDLGCQVSVDDFGAGYMSLSHLKPDLIQAVKIDAQFVKDCKSDSHNIQFIRAIMAFTQPQGIKCIAEGVEDGETADILTQEQVDYLQGYYISKPSHFRQWV